MAGLLVINKQRAGVTLISHTFIDKFLPGANGEFIKVYLLLLRLSAGDLSLSVSQMADALDNTEKDVIRALKYWEKQKLLKLNWGQDGSVLGMELLDVDEAWEAENAKSRVMTLPAECAIAPSVSVTVMNPQEEQERKLPEPVDIRALQNDADFSQLLFVAGRYLCKNLSSRDLDILANLYQGLGISEELLEYVIEYCVENDHRSLRYIERVALNWHERGITTVAEAREESINGNKKTHAIMKAFGLNGRNPGSSEQKLIDRWFRTLGLSLELVEEACNRTMRAIHTPSFEYADKILTGWHDKGILEKADIERLDKKPERDGSEGKKDENLSGETKAAEKRTGRSPGKNRFHNSTERAYDADALMKKIIGMGGDR